MGTVHTGDEILHLEATRIRDCNPDPEALGYVIETKTRTATTPAGLTTEVEWETVVFPEIMEARLYQDRAVVVDLVGKRWRVEVTLDWEDGLYNTGAILGVLLDFIPTDEDETTYTEWGEEAWRKHQEDYLTQIREDLAFLQQKDPHDHIPGLDEDIRFIREILTETEKAVAEGKTCSIPSHKVRYGGQPELGEEVVLPSHKGKAVPLLCNIPLRDTSTLNIFVAFDATGQPSAAFFQEVPC